MPFIIYYLLKYVVEKNSHFLHHIKRIDNELKQDIKVMFSCEKYLIKYLALIRNIWNYLLVKLLKTILIILLFGESIFYLNGSKHMKCILIKNFLFLKYFANQWGSFIR